MQGKYLKTHHTLTLVEHDLCYTNSLVVKLIRIAYEPTTEIPGLFPANSQRVDHLLTATLRLKHLAASFPGRV